MCWRGPPPRARRRPPRHVHAIGAEVVTPAGPGVVVAYVTAGAAEADAAEGGDDNPLHVVIVGTRKKDYRGDTLTLPPRRLTQAEITARTSSTVRTGGRVDPIAQAREQRRKARFQER